MNRGRRRWCAGGGRRRPLGPLVDRPTHRRKELPVGAPGPGPRGAAGTRSSGEVPDGLERPPKTCTVPSTNEVAHGLEPLGGEPPVVVVVVPRHREGPRGRWCRRASAPASSRTTPSGSARAPASRARSARPRSRRPAEGGWRRRRSRPSRASAGPWSGTGRALASKRRSIPQPTLTTSASAGSAASSCRISASRRRRRRAHRRSDARRTALVGTFRLWCHPHPVFVRATGPVAAGYASYLLAGGHRKGLRWRRCGDDPPGGSPPRWSGVVRRDGGAPGRGRSGTGGPTAPRRIVRDPDRTWWIDAAGGKGAQCQARAWPRDRSPSRCRGSGTRVIAAIVESLGFDPGANSTAPVTTDVHRALQAAGCLPGVRGLIPPITPPPWPPRVCSPRSGPVVAGRSPRSSDGRPVSRCPRTAGHRTHDVGRGREPPDPTPPTPATVFRRRRRRRPVDVEGAEHALLPPHPLRADRGPAVRHVVRNGLSMATSSNNFQLTNWSYCSTSHRADGRRTSARLLARANLAVTDFLDDRPRRWS